MLRGASLVSQVRIRAQMTRLLSKLIRPGPRSQPGGCSYILSNHSIGAPPVRDQVPDIFRQSYHNHFPEIKVKSMRNQGRSDGNEWLQHSRLGFNYRLSDINCAIGIAQLERIEEIVRARERVREKDDEV